MKWMEIIKINIAENRRSAFEKKIDSIAESLKTVDAESVKFYRNPLDGDLSIQLFWDKGKPEPWGSQTGIWLAQLLKGFGLISHTVWFEKEAQPWKRVPERPAAAAGAAVLNKIHI